MAQIRGGGGGNGLCRGGGAHKLAHFCANPFPFAASVFPKYKNDKIIIIINYFKCHFLSLPPIGLSLFSFLGFYYFILLPIWNSNGLLRWGGDGGRGRESARIVDPNLGERRKNNRTDRRRKKSPGGGGGARDKGEFGSGRRAIFALFDKKMNEWIWSTNRDPIAVIGSKMEFRMTFLCHFCNPEGMFSFYKIGIWGICQGCQQPIDHRALFLVFGP